MTERTLSYKSYLASIPPERRDAIETVWQTVRESVHKDSTEDSSAHDGESYRRHVREIRESSRAERKPGKAKAQGQI